MENQRVANIEELNHQDKIKDLETKIDDLEEQLEKYNKIFRNIRLVMEEIYY